MEAGEVKADPVPSLPDYNSLPRLKHLSISLYPRSSGLRSYHVMFARQQSAPVSSMLDAGLVYRHPERHEEAIVFARDIDGISAVLDYHYGRNWSRLQVRLIPEREACE